MTGLLAPMSYAQVIYLTAPKARPVVTRAAGLGAARRAGPGGGPGPARLRVHPGAAPVTPWAWLKFTIFLWLLRKTLKLTGWLLLAAAVIAAWPVTVVAAAGYAAAWLRGWPPARLYRTAAWALAASGAWLAAVEVRTPGWRPALLAPGRAWARGWDHLAAPGLGRAFLLLAPVALAGGLALGGVLWAWRIYAITTGLGGITASAPIIFDARQWNRQARTALGLTKAPGAVPLLARGGQIPVGGTIRAIGHKWQPVLAAARPRPAPGTWSSSAPPGQREDEPDDPAVGGLVHRHPPGFPGRAGGPAAAGRAGLQGRPRRPPQSRPHPPPALRRGARRVAIWPDEARLCLWDLPARRAGRGAVPDDRHRHRQRRLLRRPAPGRHHPRHPGPLRPARCPPRRSWTG